MDDAVPLDNLEKEGKSRTERDPGKNGDFGAQARLLTVCLRNTPGVIVS